jgi:hypothetical protein
VTLLAGRLFSAWTALASVIRLLCAMNPREKGIYRAAMCSFVIALGVYGYETMVSGTASFRTAMTPGIIASTS